MCVVNILTLWAYADKSYELSIWNGSAASVLQNIFIVIQLSRIL